MEKTFSKDIFVISDLHMGDRGPRDNFYSIPKENPGQRYELLKEFLGMVQKQNGVLVILGDLFEFWQANMGEVIKQNIELINILGEMDVHYVIGNHDVDFEPLMGLDIFSHKFFRSMTPPFTARVGSEEFYFCHGHECDPYNQGTRPSMGRVLAIVAGLFEDKFGVQLVSNISTEDFCAEMGEKILKSAKGALNSIRDRITQYFSVDAKKELTPTQEKNYINDLFDAIIKERQQKKFQKLIVGHTHFPGQYEDWYYNAGSWVGSRNGEPFGNFVWITKNGKVDICEYFKSKVDYISAIYKWDPDRKLITNLDYSSGEPVLVGE